MNPEPAASPLPPRTAGAQGGQRRWTVQLAAGVLALQAAFFIGVLTWWLLRSEWITHLELEVLTFRLTIAALASAHYLLIFGPLSLLAVAAVLFVLLRPRPGWVFAMAVQCVVLFLSLELYFIERGDNLVELPIVYLTMLGSILIVVFLNSPEGRLLLVRTLPAQPNPPPAPAVVRADGSGKLP
jgi:hypothetical protein